MGRAASHQHHQRHQEEPDDAVDDGVLVQQRVKIAAADDGPDEEHRHGHVAAAGTLDGLAEEGGQLPLGQHDDHAHEHRRDAGVGDGLAEHCEAVLLLFLGRGGGGVLHEVGHTHRPHHDALGDHVERRQQQPYPAEEPLRQRASEKARVGADRAILHDSLPREGVAVVAHRADDAVEHLQ